MLKTHAYGNITINDTKWEYQNARIWILNNTFRPSTEIEPVT